MKHTAVAALTLILPLAGGLDACSSGDTDDAGATSSSTPPSGSASSAAAPSPTASAQTKPAVDLAGHGGGVATYCLVPREDGHFPDFVWTGIRLRVRDHATVTGVTAQAQRVGLLHAWVVPGGGPNTGAIVPWSTGGTFLRKLDWQQRVAAKGADLAPGTPYTVVLRLRPHAGRQPGMLQHLEVDYRSATGQDSVVNQDVLKFDRSC